MSKQSNAVPTYLPLFPRPAGLIGSVSPLYRGLTITQTHTPQSLELPSRVISPPQRPISDKTQQPIQQTSISPVGFECTTPTEERQQNDALDRATIGTGKLFCTFNSIP